MKQYKILLLTLMLVISQQALSCDTAACSKALLPTTNQVTALVSGNWNTATNWSSGVVPGANANVVIPAGIAINYNRTTAITAVPVRSLLIQGTLSFPYNISTRLVVDTIVVDSTGTLNVATAALPVGVTRTVDIIFAGSSFIDTALDKQLKSRGLLSHGTVNIFGAVKTPYVDVAGTGNVVGNVITLASTPVGWRVNDSVIVTGSDFVLPAANGTQATSADYQTHDEVRSISAIAGNVITLNAPLGELLPSGLPKKHDRIHPGMKIYMGNLTRNVKFSTAAANVSTIAKRGHTMFMENPNVNINNAAFVDLGRTDKSFPITRNFVNGVLGGSTPLVTTTGTHTQFDSNMVGRYPIHIHKIGIEQTTPITFTNNVILRSPGWGVSLHSSYANISNNISYDIFASHFVTEDGNERGHMDHNLAIKAIGDMVDDPQVQTLGAAPTPQQRTQAKGYSVKDYTYDEFGNIATITEIQDDGQGGHCFWSQSRNIELHDNLANSCADSGFFFFHRHIGDGASPFSVLTTPHRDIVANHEKLFGVAIPKFASNEVPLVNITNNQATASHIAFEVVKANNNQNHNVINHIKGIRGFNVHGRCVSFGYTGKYLVEDVECYAAPGSTNQYSVALDMNILVEYMVIKDFKLVGWDYPVDTNNVFSGQLTPSAITFINGQVQLTTGDLIPFDPNQHLFLFNEFPRVLNYLPDIHNVVEPNADMVAGSSFQPTLTEIDLPVLVTNTTLNPGWWNKQYIWTAKLNDSAGVAPFSDGSPYNVNSFESKIPGSALRELWEKKVNNVYINRVLQPDNTYCVKFQDHFMDRVNMNVVPIEICIPTQQ